MKKLFFILSIVLLYARSSQAQISAPGLGDIELGNWYAVGLRQDITKDLESMTYVGTGFKIGEGDNPTAPRPSILVVNQEFYHDLNSHWKVSLAGSYRSQEEKISTISLENTTSIQQEFRVYGRVSYISKIGKAKLTQTARQEVRRFVDQDWNNTDSPLELRSRLKSQVAVALDHNQQHTLTAGAEMLFSAKKNNDSNNWSALGFKETRLTMFYTYRLKESPIALSVGYMNNMLKEKNYRSNHYLSFDVVIENPFKIF